MTVRRLAGTALAVVAAGVLGLTVATPAFAAPASGVSSAGQIETKTVEPTKTKTVEPTKTKTVEPTKTKTVEPTKTKTVEPTKTEERRELPVTGSAMTWFAVVGAAMVLGGGFLLGLVRRRREE